MTQMYFLSGKTKCLNRSWDKTRFIGQRTDRVSLQWHTITKSLYPGYQEQDLPQVLDVAQQVLELQNLGGEEGPWLCHVGCWLSTAHKIFSKSRQPRTDRIIRYFFLFRSSSLPHPTMTDQGATELFCKNIFTPGVCICPATSLIASV